MIWQDKIQDDVVVAAFLKAEASSSRFRSRIETQLKADDPRWKYIVHPDLADPTENEFRKKILAHTRGWPNKGPLMNDFPLDVTWYRAIFERSDLKDKLKYLAEASWVEGTNGSLCPLDMITNDADHPIVSLAMKVNLDGVQPILCLAHSKESECIAFEGNIRTTAFALSNQDQLQAIVGISQNASNWKYFNIESYRRHKVQEAS